MPWLRLDVSSASHVRANLVLGSLRLANAQASAALSLPAECVMVRPEDDYVVAAHHILVRQDLMAPTVAASP